MNANEAAFVFDAEGNVLLWHEPLGCSAVHIPDSKDLWDFIWENRERVAGVAHTHPWKGRPCPSREDITTFRAIENALGRLLVWPIATKTSVAYFRYVPAENAYRECPPLPEMDHWIELMSRSLGVWPEAHGSAHV